MTAQSIPRAAPPCQRAPGCRKVAMFLGQKARYPKKPEGAPGFSPHQGRAEKASEELAADLYTGAAERLC